LDDLVGGELEWEEEKGEGEEATGHGELDSRLKAVWWLEMQAVQNTALHPSGGD